jgi:hypothetical protein
VTGARFLRRLSVIDAVAPGDSRSFPAKTVLTLRRKITLIVKIAVFIFFKTFRF